MARCKYYAPNGNPSNLYDRLHTFYRSKGMNPVQAELAATTSWLATQTDKFTDFAGKWNRETTEPVTAAVDKNGEPEMLYFGESEHFNNLPVNDYNTLFRGPYVMNFTDQAPKDYSLYPFFLSIKNPKIVNVGKEFSKDDLSRTAAEFGEHDGIIYIAEKENGEVEKMYSVKNVEKLQEVYNNYERKINTEFNTSVFRNQFQTIQNEALVAAPVTDYVLSGDSSKRVLDAVMKGANSDLAKMARSILLTDKNNVQFKDGVKNEFDYQQEFNQIAVDPALSLSRDSFDTLAITEIVRGAALHSASKGTLTGMDNIVATSKIRFPNSKYKSNFDNSTAFINAVFTDANFVQFLKDSKFPGSPVSVYNQVLSVLGQQFGFKSSYSEYLSDAIDKAIFIRNNQPVTLFSSDPVDTPPADEPAAELPSKAPYGHLFTGDPMLDKAIAAIFEKIQNLKQRINKRGKELENAQIRSDILKYQEDLNDLVQKQSVDILIAVGQREMMRMKNALTKSIEYKEAWDNLNLLESWIDFSSNFDDSNSDKDSLYAVRQISINAIELYNQYKTLAWNGTVTELSKEGVPTQYLEQLTPDKIINDITTNDSLFVGLSFGQHGLEVASDYLIHNRAYKINQELIEFNQKQKELLDKLGTKDISFMFKKDANGKFRPITTYKTELYETISKLNSDAAEAENDLKPMYDQLRKLRKDMREAKLSGDKLGMAGIDSQMTEVKKSIEEAKRNGKSYASLNEFMRENFNYTLTEEGIAEFKEFAEAFKEQFWHLNDETQEMTFDQYGYERKVKEHDPEAFMAWLQDPTQEYPRFAAKYLAARPKEQWNNSEFNSFTPAQKEFYDFFVDEYLKAQANVPMDYSFTDYDADRLLREFAYMDSAAVSAFSRLTKEVKDFVKDIATVEYADNDVSYDITGPLSKKRIKKLKFKPVSSFIKGTDGYWKEGEPLPDSLKIGLDEGRYKYKDGYLVVSSKGSQNEKMVKKIVWENDNALDIFNNFVKFGMNYRYKREVEDVLNSAKEMATAIPKQPAGKKNMVNPLGIAFGSKNGSNMENRLDYTINAFLHEELKDQFVTKEGVPGERTFSFEQLIESINNFTRARQLGLNPISGLSNLSMGTINNFMYAGRDEFFNEKELRKAYGIIKDAIASFYSGGKVRVGNSQKIMLVLQQFNMLGNLHEQFYLDKAWLDKLFEHLYIFQKGGEYLNQGAVAIAMMLREKQMVDGKKVSLWDSFDVQDDRLHYKHGPDTKYANENNLYIFAEATKKVNKEIHGDYDILNPMLAKKKLAGRVGLLFRTWMPQAIKQRLGGRYKDYQLSMLKGEDVWREGRWNTFGRLMNVFTNTKKDKLEGTTRADKGKNFLYFLGAIAANTISANAGRKVINKLNLNTTDKANMYANVKEAWWLATLSVLTATLMMSLTGDDDDDELDPSQKSMLRYLYNQTSRVENELWFFYSPASFSTIFRDAVPLWSTLQQTQKVYYAAQRFIFDNEADTYKRGFRKGDSKLATQLELFFPVSKQAQSVWSMISQLYTNKFK